MSRAFQTFQWDSELTNHLRRTVDDVTQWSIVSRRCYLCFDGSTRRQFGGEMKGVVGTIGSQEKAVKTILG